MLEHDINYSNGVGKEQHAFEVNVKIGEDLNGSSVNASSTIVTDEEYLIGGRVNIQKVIMEAEALYPQITKARMGLSEAIKPMNTDFSIRHGPCMRKARTK